MSTQSLIKDLRRQLGDGAVRTEPGVLLSYSYDGTFQQRLPDAVVAARSTEEVQKVLRLANDAGVPVITRGAGTSLSGGAIPMTGGIVLVLAGMDRVLEIDRANSVAVVQPGVVTADFQVAVEKQGLFYPPDPASLRQSTIGGNLSTNAGGPRGVKYGVTRDYVKGLTVVLADGTLLELGGRLHKNATGYQLLHLFVGSEGTLGVITQAILKLIPKPAYQRTARAIFPSLDVASEGVTALLSGVALPVTLEIMDRTTLEVVGDSLGFPLEPQHQAMLIVEADGNDETAVAHEIEAMAAALAESGATQVQVARTDAERDALWRARRAVSGALGREAPNKLGEDIVVPRSQIPEIVRRVQAISAKHGFKIAVFGHAGDGNLHPNFLFDVKRPGELERLEAAAADIFRTAIDLGGALSGEHGIGTLKREFMEDAVGPAPLALMRQIKALLDPKGILNPHKLFPTEGAPLDRSGFLTALPTLNNATPG
jgi:glycolate oxidase